MPDLKRSVPDVRNFVTDVSNSVTFVPDLGAELDNIYQQYSVTTGKYNDIMLLYDIQKVMKMRGIRRFYTFLRKIGFSHSKAHRIGTNKVDKLGLDDHEKLCENLKCMPHDYMVWKPRKTQEEDEKHPLRPLLPSKRGTRAANLLTRYTLEEIRELEELMKKKQKEDKEEED